MEDLRLGPWWRITVGCGEAIQPLHLVGAFGSIVLNSPLWNELNALHTKIPVIPDHFSALCEEGWWGVVADPTRMVT